MGTQTVTVTAENGATYSITVTLPGAGPEFGVNVSVNGIDDKLLSSNVAQRFKPKRDLLVAHLGGELGPGGKWFDYGDGIATAVQHRTLAQAVEPAPVYCVKGWTDADVSSFLDTIAAPVRLSTWQEFEDDLGKSALPTIGDLVTRDRAARELIDAHPNGHLVELQLIGMGSQEDSSNGPAIWEGLDLSVYDSGGFDLYNASWRPALLPASQIVAESLRFRDAAVAANPAFKLRCSEWGIGRYVNAQPKQGVIGDLLPVDTRLSVFVDTVDTFRAEGFASADYWSSDNSDVNSDWTVTKSGDESIAAYLAEQLTR